MSSYKTIQSIDSFMPLLLSFRLATFIASLLPSTSLPLFAFSALSVIARAFAPGLAFIV